MIRSCSRMSHSTVEPEPWPWPWVASAATATAGSAATTGASGTGAGSASGASFESMNAASVSMDGASSNSWRKVIRTPNCFRNWAFAWVRNSESNPSSAKLAVASREDASMPLRSLRIEASCAATRSLRVPGAADAGTGAADVVAGAAGRGAADGSRVAAVGVGLGAGAVGGAAWPAASFASRTGSIQ